MHRKDKTSTIIGPLNFGSSADADERKTINNRNVEVDCLLCDDSSFTFDAQKDEYLAHLFLQHRLVIGEIEQISILPKYLWYWRDKFVASNFKLEDFCTVLLLNQLPDGTPAKDERYFLLSNDLPEDFEVRKRLHFERLEMVLAQHQFERTDQKFTRECLYCRDVIQPNRAAFIEHLFTKHFLQLGKAENLVFIDDLIDYVQEKIDKLICLYCEKIFKDRPTLKEHMRKKGHKRINPNNKSYDKFFLINYKNEIKPPKGVAAMDVLRESTPRVFKTNDSDSEWSDWDGEQQPLKCLFCTVDSKDLKEFRIHLQQAHGVNFEEAVLGLTFYQKVKVVNYIRRQMHTLCCVSCLEQFDTLPFLQAHLDHEQHYGIGDRKSWDKPEYFFSTYEDDAVLCCLEDEADEMLDDDASAVIGEDRNVEINLDAELLSKESLLLT